MSPSSDEGPSPSEPAGLGLTDGFEGYATPTEIDYLRVLTEGLVVPDANVLLNLYRYTPQSRNDLLSVLGALGDRLWVPHQVVHEFWTNRESTLRDPRDTEKTARELTELQSRVENALRQWSNRVSLPSAKSAELLEVVSTSFGSLIAGVDEYSDDAAAEWARVTQNDPVLTSLEEVLKGRVGHPLSEEAHDKAVKEGQRRVEAKLPPGYMDKKKPDGQAAGDYLVWEQILTEAASRGCDVVFVTADAKEDWWRIEGGERRGPRIELIEEMKKRSSSRFYMLRPPQLLSLAGSALKLSVSKESVEDADRIDRLVEEASAELVSGGWTVPLLRTLLETLDEEAPVQGQAIRHASLHNGFVTRDQVYALGGYPEGRSLRGFTRPVNRITQQFREFKMLAEEALDLFVTVYNNDSPGIGWAAGFRVPAQILPILETAIEELDGEDPGPS